MLDKTLDAPKQFIKTLFRAFNQEKTHLNVKRINYPPWCMSIFFLALKGLSGRRAEEDVVLFVLELALFLDGLEIDSN